MDAKKSELFLPDGKPTELCDQDELVWQKLSGKFTLRRPGAGDLRTDPPLPENPFLTGESATAEEVRKQYAYGLSGALPLDVELINDNDDEAVFRFVRAAAILFLPNGTGTEPMAGDVLVWEKDAGTLHMQRPGVGRLHSPMLDGNLMARDEASVRELEREIRTDLGWALAMIDFKLIDESADRAVFQFTGPEAAS